MRRDIAAGRLKLTAAISVAYGGLLLIRSLVAGSVCATLLLTYSASAQSARELAAAPGRIMVKFRDSVSPEQARTALRSLRSPGARELTATRVHIVELPPQASVQTFRDVLRNRPDVEWAEPDYLRHPAQPVIPNDPHYANQWHLPRISAPSAWSLTTGDPSVIIAVADTGVDATHPDLISKMVSGWNTADNNSNTADVHGHGTMVAGAAAAASNNAVGGASVAWRCWIMPIRVSLADGMAYDSAIAEGIIWAADHGARVVNVSYDVTNSSTVASAARYMNGKGGVVTISAGNYSTFDTFANDPAIITVGATDQNDVKYTWSDYGTPLDVVAPGCVWTTVRGGTYATACGTSFSAPVTAGVAALVLSAKPSLTAVEVSSILSSTADDLGTSGRDDTFGWGRINAYKAVSASLTTVVDTQPPSLSFLGPAASAIIAGSVSVQVSATDNQGVASLTIAVNGTIIGMASSFVWDTTRWTNGSYVLVASARDAAGNTTTASRSVSVRNIKDITPPTVSVTGPAAGSTLSGNVNLTATAADNIGVTQVQFFVDGVLTGTAANAPFAVRWNTRKVSQGTHRVEAKARDAAGNTGTSTPIFITVRP